MPSLIHFIPENNNKKEQKAILFMTENAEHSV